MRRILIALIAILCTAQKCSDVEKRVCGEKGKLVVRDGKPVCVYPSPEPTTTTTTSTTSTTSTTTTSTTTTTLPPTPAPGCSLPMMPECGGPEGPTGVYGCCITDKARPLPPSPFDDVLDQVQTDEENAGTIPRDPSGRVDEAAYTAELVRRLRAKGLCATVGGPGDEVGIKGSNAESYQYDVVFANGRPRRSGFVAFCHPARFD